MILLIFNFYAIIKLESISTRKSRNLMDITSFVPLIAAVIIGGLILLTPSINRLLDARRLANEVKRDMQDARLEEPALNKLKAFRQNLMPTDRRINMRLMFAWGELPSYVTAMHIEQGIDAVIQQIEAKFLRRIVVPNKSSGDWELASSQ